MVSAAPRILTNAWVKASWKEYVAIADVLDNQTKLEKAQFYYDNGFMRIENMTTGFSHGRNHSLLASAIQTSYRMFNHFGDKGLVTHSLKQNIDLLFLIAHHLPFAEASVDNGAAQRKGF